MTRKMKKNNTKFEKALAEFDVIAYLEGLGVDYSISGKNIARNNIGIHCYNCSDTSYHLNIHLESKIYSCWRCPTVSGSIVDLVRMMEGIPRHFASKRVKKLLRLGRSIELPEDYDLSEEVSKRLKPDEVKAQNHHEEVTEAKRDFALPKTKALCELNTDLGTHRVFVRYIKKRGWTIEELEAWGIEACIIGYYKMRLYMPVIYKGRVVNFIARDVTGKAERHYLNHPNDSAIKSMKSVLYGYDFVKKGRKRLILAEGAFDVISIGKGKAVGMMSKSMTTAQQKMLKRLRPKEVVIMLDNDIPKDGVMRLSETWADARKLAGALSAVASWKISIAQLPPGCDPGEMTSVGIKKAVKERERIQF